MKKEIERKFLVKGDDWRKEATGLFYKQGYLVADEDKAIRIRIAGEQGYLTIKKQARGLEREEFEYNIPKEDAQSLLLLCHDGIIEKIRYTLPASHGLIWEIDEFLGENKGLILAEIEIPDESQEFVLPSFIGKEVSFDPRYFNSYLSKVPYSKWGT
ncbi:MAG: CYTH domain-containing protein [Candidatus Brocadiae bacterium]|nr:CYTH domain-containing protein [Candidatus Brocadiia bacterium]